jgi:hypothetical protein
MRVEVETEHEQVAESGWFDRGPDRILVVDFRAVAGLHAGRCTQDGGRKARPDGTGAEDG